jgi:hypothetical protein
VLSPSQNAVYIKKRVLKTRVNDVAGNICQALPCSDPATSTRTVGPDHQTGLFGQVTLWGVVALGYVITWVIVVFCDVNICGVVVLDEVTI